MIKKVYLNICLFLALLFSLSATQAQIVLNGHIQFSNCDSQTTRFSASNYDTGLRIEVFFGDGTSSPLDTFFNGGTTATRVYVNHVYAFAGIYTVDAVLLLNGVPIDPLTYSDTVTLCHYIHISSYRDNNSDCVFDAGDTYMPNPYTIEIDSAGVAIDTITATSFSYDASGSAPTGTIYKFKIITPPAGYMVTCPTSGIVYDTIGTTAGYHSFGFTCDTASFDLSVYGWFSPGVTGACSHVYAMNYGCTPQVATVTLYYSSKYAYASVSPSTVTAAPGAGFVTFNVGTLSPASATSFIAYLTPVGTPSAGDTVNSTWIVDPIAGDVHPSNNTLIRCDTVHASFDPNEKAVTPQGYIYAGTQLEYKIGFENTGNDTAFNIHVQDTLSDNVDISTIKLVSASAHTDMSLSTFAGHNIVKFDFQHINLMDATHPGQNTGMVVFDVKAKTGLPGGTLINNKAGIYFDYNPVIMTNKVTNIIGYPAGIATMSTPEAAIYPNPATDAVTVKISMGSYSVITMNNTIGQTVMQKPLAATETLLNVKALPAGIYYVTLTGDNGSRTFKFLKQ